MAQNYGLTGAKFVLFPGEYWCVPFQADIMGMLNDRNKISSIKVEAAEGTTAEGAVKLYARIPDSWFWKYRDFYVFNVGVGDWDASGRYFPNDRLWKVEVPEGKVVTLYQNGDKSGSSVVFRDPGLYRLSNYGMDMNVSRVVVSLENYSDAGTEFGTPEKISESLVATAAGANTNSSAVEQSTEAEIARDISTETSLEWQNGGSVSVTAGFTLKLGGEASTVSAEISVESTTEYNFSKTSGKTETETISYSSKANVNVPARSTAEYTLAVYAGKYRIPFTKLFKNDRTGEIVRRGGTLISDNAFRTEVHYNRVVPLDA